MRLDNAAGAVVESCSGAKRLSEELSSFLLIVSFCSRPVDCVSHCIRSECSSKRVWSSLLGFLSIGWTKDISESGDSSLRDKFHSSADITLHVGTEIWEEWLSFMLVIELIGLLWACELAHFQLRNGETVLVDCINNLTSLSVTVWFHHGKGPWGSWLELVLGEDISVVDKSQLSRSHSDDRSKEKFSCSDILGGHSFHEGSFLLDIVLFQRLKLKEFNLPFQQSNLLGRRWKDMV